jgi:hypothetical protein
MRAHVIEGSKERIAREISQMPGPVLEAIVFVPEAEDQQPTSIFDEMTPETVHVHEVDDSREAIYTRQPGE